MYAHILPESPRTDAQKHRKLTKTRGGEFTMRSDSAVDKLACLAHAAIKVPKVTKSAATPLSFISE